MTPSVAERLQPKGTPNSIHAAYGAIKVLAVAASPIIASIIVGQRQFIPHAALLYRWKKGELRLFEMRSHKELRDVAVPNVLSFVWIEPTLPPERLRLIAIKARLVHERHQEHGVPYGFGYHASTFDENGGLRLGENEIGLTCSTVVAAIFESERVRLVDAATWPPPDAVDKAARATFLQGLRLKDAEHAKLLAGDIESPRISPEEVVAAAALHPAVGTFETVQEGAADVRARIGTT